MNVECLIYYEFPCFSLRFTSPPSSLPPDIGLLAARVFRWKSIWYVIYQNRQSPRVIYKVLNWQHQKIWQSTKSNASSKRETTRDKSSIKSSGKATPTPKTPGNLKPTSKHAGPWSSNSTGTKPETQSARRHNPPKPSPLLLRKHQPRISTEMSGQKEKLSRKTHTSRRRQSMRKKKPEKFHQGWEGLQLLSSQFIRKSQNYLEKVDLSQWLLQRTKESPLKTKKLSQNLCRKT